jgi:hypothetical protein
MFNEAGKCRVKSDGGGASGKANVVSQVIGTWSEFSLSQKPKANIVLIRFATERPGGIPLAGRRGVSDEGA